MAYFEQNNLTANLFELWVSLIAYMKYDFELRRSMMGFTSLFLLDLSKINNMLSSNLGFILKKIIYFGEKLIEYYTKKKLTAGQINQYSESSQVKIKIFLS